LRKYKAWAYLNADGKALFGDVFPDGEVPVQSILPKQATLTGVEGTEKVLLLDWKELTRQQQDALLSIISRTSGAGKDVILKEILKVGMPLRERYTEGGGTSQLGLFT
jgi:hypothetical protein